MYDKRKQKKNWTGTNTKKKGQITKGKTRNTQTKGREGNNGGRESEWERVRKPGRDENFFGKKAREKLKIKTEKKGEKAD